MRLADLIAARAWKNPKSDEGRLAAAVAPAQRFELDEAARNTMATFAWGSGNRMLDAMPLARLPFPSMWVEWIGASSAGLPGQKPAGENEYTPKRTGFLFEAADPSHNTGLVTLAWCTDYNGALHLNISPLCATFDWREDNASPVPTIVPLPSMGEVRKIFPKASEREILQLHFRTGIIENPRTHDMAERLIKLRSVDFQKFAAVQSQTFQDWSGEMRFAQAILVCINSKNLMRTEEGADNSALNKARARLGRPPLLSYSTVRVNLSAVMRRKVGGDPTGERLRAHLVRGHFKIRKTGVFWWSPFLRGDAELGTVARAGYRISDRPRVGHQTGNTTEIATNP